MTWYWDWGVSAAIASLAICVNPACFRIKGENQLTTTCSGWLEHKPQDSVFFEKWQPIFVDKFVGKLWITFDDVPPSKAGCGIGD
jgi:hypothetical protein